MITPGVFHSDGKLADTLAHTARAPNPNHHHNCLTSQRAESLDHTQNQNKRSEGDGSALKQGRKETAGKLGSPGNKTTSLGREPTHAFT